MDSEARNKIEECWQNLRTKLAEVVSDFNRTAKPPQWKHNSGENCFWVARDGEMLHCRLKQEQDRYVVEVEKNTNEFFADVSDLSAIGSVPYQECPEFGKGVETTKDVPYYIIAENDGEGGFKAVLLRNSDSTPTTIVAAAVKIFNTFLSEIVAS